MELKNTQSIKNLLNGCLLIKFNRKSQPPKHKTKMGKQSVQYKHCGNGELSTSIVRSTILFLR